MAQNIFNQVMPRLVNPTAAVDNSSEKVWGSVTHALDSISRTAINDWQKATVEKASQEGAIAGAEGKPEYKEGESYSAKAYNQAAVKMHMQNISMTANARFNEMAVANATNPTEFNLNADTYRKQVVEDLAKNPATRTSAALLDLELKQKQQQEAYKIQKKQQALQKDQFIASTEDLAYNVQNDSLMAAADLTADDPTIVNNALVRISDNKKKMEIALHAVGPDGQPLYTAQAIQKQMLKYNQDLWMQVARSKVDSGDFSAGELEALTKGTYQIRVAGGGAVDLMREVGQSNYNQIVNSAFDSVKRKDAEVARQEAAIQRATTKYQAANDVRLIEAVSNQLETGEVVVTADQVIKSVERHEISRTTGLKVIDLLHNPNAMQVDNPAVTQISAKILNRVDQAAVIDRLTLNGDITPKTANKLRLENAKMLQGTFDSRKKQLMKEVIVKDPIGFDTPESLAQSFDVGEQYDHLVHVEKMDPALAMEKVRENIATIRSDNSAMNPIKHVPIYMISKPDNTIDLDATYAATKDAEREGRLNPVEAAIELKYLEALKKKELGK